jgi:uncharacterized membrane protein YccC
MDVLGAGARRNIARVQRAYHRFTRAAGLLIAALGVVMVVTTLARGGGPLALGVVVGVAFTLFGAGRLYLARNGT